MAKNKKVQDGTALPRSLDPRYKAAIAADKQRVEFEKAKAKQPSLSSGKPANIEETKRRNKAYAKKQGLGYDEASGRVYDPISPQTSKTLEAAYENIVEPMMMLEGVGAVGGVAKQAVKEIIESGVLSNAYRLNPFTSRQLPRSGNAVDDWFRMREAKMLELENANRAANLEELRRVYHNSERFLQPEESRLLHKHGHGNASQYINPDRFDWSVPVRNNNQLPPPSSEIRFMPDGTTRTVYSQQPIWQQTWGTGNWNPNNPILSKPKIVNKSGLTKEEALAKASSKDKDSVSKMSETEFENTVLKPNGEIVPYYQGSLESQFSGSQNVTALSPKQYADEFNSRLDLLNDIIAQRNKSGVNYQVKGLDESGILTFYTPPGQKGKNPLIKRGLEDVNIPEGESSWNVRLNPGQWRGNVEDIANKEYFRSIPGLEMSNTTSGVFADNVPRKGTGAYEAINEYLKRFDLGRVKPGFNSQTEFSRGAWENFIKSGRGVGYYASPKTVYGTMKTIVPPAAIIGAAAIENKQQGGSVESYMGGLTDKGFNYNGAWGGTMQMGGNLPGAVGNMYSRDGAPSNGKYAKKTKASAAEGMEILPDPTDPDRKYKLSATIASAKEILNPLLRAKDPAAYDAWTKGRVQALREKGFPAMREYTEKNPISIYLSPQEVKAALSKQREGFYEDYLGAIRGLKDYESELGAPMRESLYGGKEGAGDLENLNYGWRFATLPTNVSRQATTTSGKPIPEESFMYSYDPVKDEYKRTPYYKNGGKMMSYYQAGLDFQPKTISKKGSKIKKDNDGYWNPENWGKPVEIDSNEITMQGVYEPLLGISDTGDVQMMYPGEDYEFDGESVTEYPVAQNGVGIPKDIYGKQLYKESRFNPKAISPKGEDAGRGIAQISKSIYNDFLKATKYKPEQIDLMNPAHAIAVQKWAMNDLYNSEFINKPNQSNEVRLAKTLAAYNYGRGKLSKALVAAKEKGMDIYNSLDWLKVVPEETSDYVNKILLKKDDKFEKEYSEAIKKSPYTKYFKTGGNINQLDEAPLKKLDDLLNFTNMGKKRNIKKGQMGIASVSPTTLDLSMNAAMATAPKTLSNVAPTISAPKQMSAPKTKGFDAGMLGGSPLAKTIQNVQRFSDALKERKKAKVFKNVSEVVKEAATSRPDMPKRKYVRPEDNLLSPDQSSFQSFGTGYDILSQARDGMQIGGNLTEIQNMYTTPDTLYSNLGYEPLEDSQMKQYKKGGKLPHAQTGMEMQAAMQVMDLGLGLQGALAEAIPGIQTKKWTEEGLQNMQQGAYNQALSNQFGAFMKDGGWVSHDWQPQVITKFGDYTMDQLLTPPDDAEMLRAGGNIRSNYMGDDERLSMMAMGGNLQTHWGGKGEVMSYNPYSAGSGETVMLRGQSHEETDGRGNSGIGMSYGGNMVEAERGEPVAEMQEGGAVGDTAAVVFGNMKVPSYGVSELGDDKAKGRKFKSYAADLSKQEAKQNKIVDKATKLVNDTDGDDAFDLLKMNAGMAMLTGADMKLKDLANKKKTLATIQNAILSTAEEMGLESDALAKGKIMQAKKGAKIPKGQTGVLLPKDEFDFMSRGYNTPQIDFGGEYSRYLRPMSTNAPAPTAPFSPFEIDLQKGSENPYAWSLLASSFQKPNNVDNYPLYTMQTEGTPTDNEPVVKLDKKMLRKLTKDNKSDSSKIKDFINENEGYIGMGYNELLPYIRPTNKLPLDPFQLMGEQLALATNVLEPVQAQTITPMLETRAPKLSAQEALNKNQADFNALARQIGNNPAALSMLAAQKQAADRQAIAQVEAVNLQQEMAANNRNIAMLNDATLKNLAILDTQYQRQAGAKANTKAQAQAALNSIASKIGQNKLENFQSGVMQNMYNYRFGPQGRIINYNPLAKFQIPNIADMSDEQVRELQEALDKRKPKDNKSRNGSIVKAIKNL